MLLPMIKTHYGVLKKRNKKGFFFMTPVFVAATS